MARDSLRGAALAGALGLALAPIARADTWSSTDAPVATVDHGSVSLPVIVDTPFVVSDVNVIVTLEHADVSQLRVSLRHPDGTVVPLCASLPGTELLHMALDDEAAAPPSAGTAPYTGSWQPQQPLSAFDGKPAAGAWMLEVEDTAAGLAGSVQSATLGFNGRTFVSTQVPLPITDFLTATSTVLVDTSLLVEDVELTVWIDHTCPGDMRPELHAPGGASASVTTGVFQCRVPGGMQGTTWDDESAFLILDAPAPHHGRFKAQSPWGPPLSALDGPQGSGLWSLAIPDTQWGDEGTLRAWSVHITGPELCPGEQASAESYGSAVAGTFGPPLLHATSPAVGSTLTVTLLTGSPVSSFGALFVGAQPAAFPGHGGTLLVDPLFSTPIVLPAHPAIQIVYTGGVPADAGLCGAELFLQVLQLDPGAPQGVAFSQGMHLHFGG